MKIAVLTRFRCTPEGTKGLLEVGDKTFFTIERPWLANRRMESCIPTGSYVCSLVNSPRFGRVYGVKNVPGRSHILIHAGNTPVDTNGCILPGLTHDPTKMFVGSSKSALSLLHELLEEEDFELVIQSS